MKKSKRTIIEFIAFIMLIIFDQYTKILAVKFLKDQAPYPIIKGVLELYYLPNGNTGAAFGMLEGHIGLFLVIALAVVTIIAFILFNIPLDKKYTVINVLLVFIAAGGIGNMIDRLVQAYVVDFIYFSLINFPIFNVADIYVTVATIILAIYILFVFNENDIKELEMALKKPFNKSK